METMYLDKASEIPRLVNIDQAIDETIKAMDEAINSDPYFLYDYLKALFTKEEIEKASLFEYQEKVYGAAIDDYFVKRFVEVDITGQE